MKPYIIGVSGGSGSGKTQFIKSIIEDFHNEQVCYLSQDNYYRQRDEQLVDENGVKNFDMPESIDLDRFLTDIQKLVNGENFSMQEYTFNNAMSMPAILEFKPAPVVIIEGIFIFHAQEIRDWIDLKIFMDAPEHIMLKRRIIRDEQERGYDLSDVLYRFENHVMPSYNTYILPYKSECDIIINNHSDISESLKVIRNYISSLL
jgi:uridine kinase